MPTNDIAINFRNSAGYATDDATETHALVTESYQTVRGGESFGISNGTVSFADRDAALDRRLAGIMFGESAAGIASRFRIDLPAAGVYTVYLAMGDGASGQSSAKVIIKDDTTTKITIGPHNTLEDEFYDASDVNRTAAAWPGSNVGVNVTFASAICNIDMGDGAGHNGMITHIRLVRSVTAAPGARSVVKRASDGVVAFGV